MPQWLALGTLLISSGLCTTALAQEKLNHGVSQDLLDLAARPPGQQVRPESALTAVRDSYVVIDAASEDPAALLQDLQALGLREGAMYGYMVSGLLPISSINSLTQLSTLRLARPAYAAKGTGSVNSEGDAAMHSDDARTIYSINGAGITVGTLSDSYNCLGGAPGNVTSNDLPAGVTVFSDLTMNCTDEGRAMMQIVHDVAPGVAQGFHTAFNGQADFALGIEELAGCPPGSAAGCTAVAGFAADVINDDVFYFGEPFFQDGIIAQAVGRVVSSGVAYFVLAGNHGRESYQAPFRSSGMAGGGGGTLHDFDPGAGTDVSQRITIPAGTMAQPVSVTFSFQWVDRYFSVSGAPGAASNLNIFIRDTAGTLRASSTNGNVGADPIEVFTFTNNGSIDADGNGVPDTQFDIQIELASGAAPALIKYIALVNGAVGNFTQNEWDTQSSTIYGHMNSATGETVGAAYYQNTPEFGTDPPVVEGFSSAGPTPIYFDTAGNAVGPITRNKPDIVAPDGANNTFFGPDRDGDGNPNFSGTSAATPHAAAVGALLLEAAGGAGSLTPATVFTNLESTAIDMDDPLTAGFDAGFDFRTGFGLVNALDAIHLYLNADPVADAGPDQDVECTGPTGATVTLDGSGSTDPEDDPLTYTWKEGPTVLAGPTTAAMVNVLLPLGVHTITLSVDDGNGSTDTDEVEVTVEDTTPPVITLLGPSEITLECGVDPYVEFGATVADVCDPTPTLVIDASALDTHTPGDYPVVYTATDASTNEGTATRTVHVVDTTPPVITVNAGPMSLWPPNHKYRVVSLADLDIEATDACDENVSGNDVVIASASSDEPENAKGNGDGNTMNDLVIAAGCRSISLRAERQGRANGRVYTLALQVADASGNVGEASYQVHVPHDRHSGPFGIDDGPVYTVAGCDLAALVAANDSEARASEEESSQTEAVKAEASDGTEATALKGAEGVPTVYALDQNYPNPFNSNTTIAYELPEAAYVTLQVFNVLGQEVARLVDEEREVGRHKVTLDAGHLSPGVYFYVLRANTHTIARRMSLLE